MASIRAPNSGDVKEFDARTANLVVDGDDAVEDIESFGYDQSKDHDLQYTIDQNAVWVKATPDLSGSFVLKATSPSLPTVEQLFMQDEVFNIDVTLSDDAFGGEPDQLTFVGAMVTDYSHSDYEIDGMPTVSVDWQAVNREE